MLSNISLRSKVALVTILLLSAEEVLAQPVQQKFVFAKWATVSPPAGWTFLAGYFAGDNKLDVVGYHPSNGTLWVGTASR